MADQSSFLGTGWGFPPTFKKFTNRGGQVGSVAMVSDLDDIRSSLELLLGTEVGERVMQPRYGCSLRRFLFEPLDTGLQAYIKDLITTAILYFEPRVVLENLMLKPQVSEGAIEIHIQSTVAATNTRANFVFPFYKQEGTEVQR